MGLIIMIIMGAVCVSQINNDDASDTCAHVGKGGAIAMLTLSSLCCCGIFFQASKN
jgi:hypothetical protein